MTGNCKLNAAILIGTLLGGSLQAQSILPVPIQTQGVAIPVTKIIRDNNGLNLFVAGTQNDDRVVVWDKDDELFVSFNEKNEEHHEDNRCSS